MYACPAPSSRLTMSWHIPLQLGDGGAELMGCALSPDGIYVDAPVRMGEVCIEKALYVEGVQFESHEEGDMGGVEIESHEEGDMGGGQMLSTDPSASECTPPPPSVFLLSPPSPPPQPPTPHARECIRVWGNELVNPLDPESMSL